MVEMSSLRTRHMMLCTDLGTIRLNRKIIVIEGSVDAKRVSSTLVCLDHHLSLRNTSL